MHKNCESSEDISYDTSVPYTLKKYPDKSNVVVKSKPKKLSIPCFPIKSDTSKKIKSTNFIKRFIKNKIELVRSLNIDRVEKIDRNASNDNYRKCIEKLLDLLNPSVLYQINQIINSPNIEAVKEILSYLISDKNHGINSLTDEESFLTAFGNDQNDACGNNNAAIKMKILLDRLNQVGNVSNFDYKKKHTVHLHTKNKRLNDTQSRNLIRSKWQTFNNGSCSQCSFHSDCSNFDNCSECTQYQGDEQSKCEFGKCSSLKTSSYKSASDISTIKNKPKMNESFKERVKIKPKTPEKVSYKSISTSKSSLLNVSVVKEHIESNEKNSNISSNPIYDLLSNNKEENLCTKSRQTLTTKQAQLLVDLQQYLRKRDNSKHKNVKPCEDSSFEEPTSLTKFKVKKGNSKCLQDGQIEHIFIASSSSREFETNSCETFYSVIKPNQFSSLKDVNSNKITKRIENDEDNTYTIKPVKTVSLHDDATISTQVIDTHLNNPDLQNSHIIQPNVESINSDLLDSSSNITSRELDDIDIFINENDNNNCNHSLTIKCLTDNSINATNADSLSYKEINDLEKINCAARLMSQELNLNFSLSKKTFLNELECLNRNDLLNEKSILEQMLFQLEWDFGWTSLLYKSVNFVSLKKRYELVRMILDGIECKKCGYRLAIYENFDF